MTGPRGDALLVLFDLLGRRWTLRILWELRERSLSSRALAARCGGISPTVLHRRLRELRAAQLVEHEQKRGFGVSALGGELLARLRPLKGWAARWARRTDREPSRDSADGARILAVARAPRG